LEITCFSDLRARDPLVCGGRAKCGTRFSTPHGDQRLRTRGTWQAVPGYVPQVTPATRNGRANGDFWRRVGDGRGCQGEAHFLLGNPALSGKKGFFLVVYLEIACFSDLQPRDPLVRGGRARCGTRFSTPHGDQRLRTSGTWQAVPGYVPQVTLATRNGRASGDFWRRVGEGRGCQGEVHLLLGQSRTFRHTGATACDAKTPLSLPRRRFLFPQVLSSSTVI
jgi:hypothetical protein